MLDYAANCLTYWSVETLKLGLKRTCDENGQPVEAALSELIGMDTSVEEFWQLVKTNLQAKRIRMLFVADVIPLELRRIVEFLNEQMDPAEVLAIRTEAVREQGPQSDGADRVRSNPGDCYKARRRGSALG